jgi:osmotically-inducible protein OsmY
MVTSTVSSSAEQFDRQLADRVSALLAQRNVPSLRRLQVEARGSIVTLRGRVGSFYEKQLSHHAVRQIAEVSQLIDLIDVRSHDLPPSRRVARGWHLKFAR